MNTGVSVYGSTGFIGSRFCEMYPDTIRISREQNTPQSKDILYFISTTHNYHIFDEPHKDVDTNLNKLISVLEEFRNTNECGTFNFISSWFVYGMNCSLDTKETDICDPRGFYSITKRAAEQMLVCYCNTFGMKYRIMRLCNIIGKTNTKASAKKNALQHMIGLLKKNEPVKLYDNGTNIRDFMCVDDTCRAISTCMTNAPTNEIINISNSQGTSIGDAIKFAKQKLGSSSELVSIDPPHFHSVVQVKNVVLNNKKLLSYGYNPSINTMQAIETML
jgi:nucleoside-diphosphate-sugar epimerase